MRRLDEILRNIQRDVENADPIPESEADTIPACDLCHGAGHVLVPVDEQGRTIQDDPLPPTVQYMHVFCPSCERGRELKARAFKKRYEQSELPVLYRQASLNDINNLGAIFSPDGAKGKLLAYLAAREFVSHAQHRVSWHAICRRIQSIYGSREYPAWVDEDLQTDDDVRDGLVLWGGLGTGKTHIAAAVVNEITRQGEYAMYMRMSDILQSLTDTWSSDEATGEVLRKYEEVPVLFIDDMNIESRRDGSVREHEVNYAAAIMRYRTNHRLPTLITTNWSPQQFSEKWGSWCADVVLTYHWVEVRGRKVRYAKPKERAL
jgi:hypothetical protein